MSNSNASIKGEVTATLIGPDGTVKAQSVTRNKVTAVGDQFYAGRAVLSSGLPAAVTGFKLGTGATTGGNAPAKTGTGAALATYLPTSNQPNDSGFPTATGGVVTWKCTFAPGEATSAVPITEVVLVTDSIASNATSTEPNTIARAAITGIASKAAGDTLVVQWTHTVAGA